MKRTINRSKWLVKMEEYHPGWFSAVFGGRKDRPSPEGERK
jgi:hypothetical protein